MRRTSSDLDCAYSSDSTSERPSGRQSSEAPAGRSARRQPMWPLCAAWASGVKGITVAHGVDVRTGSNKCLDNNLSILESGGVKERPSTCPVSEVGIATPCEVLEYWLVRSLVEILVQAVEHSLVDGADREMVASHGLPQRVRRTQRSAASLQSGQGSSAASCCSPAAKLMALTTLPPPVSSSWTSYTRFRRVRPGPVKGKFGKWPRGPMESKVKESSDPGGLRYVYRRPRRCSKRTRGRVLAFPAARCLLERPWSCFRRPLEVETLGSLVTAQERDGKGVERRLSRDGI